MLNDCEEYPFGWLASTVNVHSRSLYLSLSLTRSYGECISDLTLNQVDSATACRNPRRTKTEYRHHPVASPYDTPPYWVRYAHTDRQDTHKQIAAPTRVQVITFTRTRRPPPPNRQHHRLHGNAKIPAARPKLREPRESECREEEKKTHTGRPPLEFAAAPETMVAAAVFVNNMEIGSAGYNIS